MLRDDPFLVELLILDVGMGDESQPRLLLVQLGGPLGPGCCDVEGGLLNAGFQDDDDARIITPTEANTAQSRTRRVAGE